MTNVDTNPSVDAARKRWMERLIDVSRNNNLLYYRQLKAGTLDATTVSQDVLRALLSGEKVVVRELLPAYPEADLKNRVSTIRKRALTNLEEKGLETLYLAYGAATWTETDGGRPPNAVVLLLPATFTTRGLQQIQISGSPQINLALLHVLQTQFGVNVNAEMLLDSDVDTDGSALSIGSGNTVFDRLRLAAKDVPGFKLLDSLVIGNFSFQKMAMLRDIRDHGQQIASHTVLAAMAGSGDARTTLARDRRDVPLDALDATPPDGEFLVLDADSSQQRVIASAANLQSGVIQGPPGTGKSQTIVNLITTLTAQGKRVLFVAEKRAALQVVRDRLERVGLGHLVLDLHGGDISSRSVLSQIASSMDSVRDTPAISADAVHRGFVNQRTRLNQHVARLHTPRGPQKRTLYDLQGALLRHSNTPQTSARWRGADVTLLSNDGADRLRQILSEARGVAKLFARTDPSPWTNATLPNVSVAQRTLDAAVALSQRYFPALVSQIESVCAVTGLRRPDTLESLTHVTQALNTAGEISKRYGPAVFGASLNDFAAAAKRANNGAKRLWARLTNGAYKAGLQTLRAHHGGPLSETQASLDADALCDLRDRWRAMAEVASSLPSFSGDANVLCATAQAIEDHAAVLRAALPAVFTPSQLIADAHAFAVSLAADTLTPLQVPQVRVLEDEAIKLGAAQLLAELGRCNIAPDDWSATLDHAMTASLHDQARVEAPELLTFQGRVHEEQIAEFRSLDRKRIELAVARVKRAHAEHVVAVRNQYPEENALIKEQATRKRARMQLRELLARAPHVLTALFPCWMASPLSISQLLAADQRCFDVVLFDEASQVLPEDAVPAIMRAEHVIVAGDRHQLPPTTFFASGGDRDDDSDDAESSAVDGFESLLDQMTAISETWSLDWHYRSRDESLIHFSNHHIYSNRLITFPGPASGTVINHELVDGLGGGVTTDGSVTAEVQRVVNLVLEHARTRPRETLGVIAMGITHANRIESALEHALRAAPELEPFFDPQRPERFFVKNLERVQGDERDAIIISIGYGKDSSGRLPYRFGPLLTNGGERRLNVAITRARQRLTLVSSFSHRDMDPVRSTKRGVELLRLYLEYAASKGRNVGESQRSQDIALNPFEDDVHDALTRAGLRLLPQWGASGYRIDFAVQHPERPGEFVLALECDGASYHSAATARDRDRLRQQVLESLGWRFCRIWSTDWFNHRDEEVARVLQAYETAVADGAVPNERVAPNTTRTMEMSASVSASLATTDVHAHNVPARESIDHYRDDELLELVRWVQADGRLRDNSELFEAVFEQLPFKSRGRKITARINDVISKAGLQPARTFAAGARSAQSHTIPEFTLEANLAKVGKASRTLVTGNRGEAVTVEEFVLQHMASEGFRGKHTENVFWWQMFALLYADQILPSPNRPAYDRNDLAVGIFSKETYETQFGSLIERRHEELLKIASRAGLRDTITKSWRRRDVQRVRWFMDAQFDLSDHLAADANLPAEALLSLVCQLAQHYPARRTGFPDLFVVGGGRTRFIEVKQIREVISPAQRYWHAFLHEHGFSIEVCRVQIAPSQ
jgi:very-short-patch-repair endonuclease